MSIQENMRQITKNQNSHICLEFNDKMSPADVKFGSNIHSNYSKIGITIIDTTNGGGSNATVVECNVSPVKIKRLHEKVVKIEKVEPAVQNKSASASQATFMYGHYKGMTAYEAIKKDGETAVQEMQNMIPTLEKNANRFPKNKKIIEEINSAIREYSTGNLKTEDSSQISKKIIPLLYEKKILPGEKNKNPDNPDEQKVTELTIEYNSNMDSPFMIKICNGWGKAETTKTGGTKIGSGSYRTEKSAKAVVGDERFREMLIEITDFIRYREQQMINSIRPKIEEIEKQRWTKNNQEA